MADGTSVGSLYYDLSIEDKNLKGQLDSADKKVGDFGERLHDNLNKAAAGFAVVGAGLTLIAKNATDFTVDLVKSSKALGMQIGTSTEEASRLVAAFGRMGVGADSASQMFGIFSKQVVKATDDAKNMGLAQQKTQIDIDKTRAAIAATTAQIAKSGDSSGALTLKLRELNNQLATQQAALSTSANAFQKLGISTVDAQGKQRSFNDLLFEVADRFKGMKDGMDKNALSMELFGRSGKDMIKVLNLGSEGIKDLEAQADKLGLTLTSGNIAAVNDYVKSQKDLKQSTDALKIAIGTATAPVLTSFNKALNDMMLGLIKSDGPMKTITVDVLAFGGPILTAAGGVLAFAANMVTAWPAIVAFAGAMWGVAMAIGAAVIAALPFILIGAAIAAVALVLYYKWNDVVWLLQYLWNWVTNNWPYLLGALTGPFGLAVAFIADHIGQIKDIVVNAAADAWHWLYNAGKSIIDGLVQGIKDKVSDAVNAVKNVGKSVVNAARNALDWHSPSKVFIEAGKSISEGMAIGINRSAGMAMSAMNALSNNVISPAINVSGDGGARSGGNTTKYGDTIVNIGQVNNKQDEDMVIRRIDRNAQLVSMGGTPLGAQG